ncbi:MAG: hypothetical protein M3457_00555 [Chloroflexota bacterium]|nr:hypothetical protein [Chloroflexota bacterium]
MAYRFLLEVPENLTAEANVAVASAGDAQVLVDRAAHGLGVDVPYHNLTVAAHSLRVVSTLYAWAGEIGATRSDSRFQIGVVLHNGKRIGLHDVDAPALVAAIRRDQPWVETSAPKIGDHERETVAGLNTNLELVSSPATGATATVAAVATLEQAPPATITAVNLIDADDEVTIRGRNFAVIQVLELAPAEALYAELLGLSLGDRLRQEEDGVWEEVEPDYDHALAEHAGTEADVSFLHNGPLNVALRRAGRAARLDYSIISNQIAVAMEPPAAAGIKAKVLIRGYTLLAAEGPAFTFRDPFGVAWSIHPHRA